jgi:hypothetical protein
MIFGDIIGEPFPLTTEEWSLLLQRNRLLGFIYLNALDIASIAVLSMMFLALYAALKHDNKVGMTIATPFAFLGIGVFITTRSLMLSAFAFSDQFIAATTDTQKTLVLAAYNTINTLGIATPQTAGFFFMAIAVLIISVVMLKSKSFAKIIAIMGILNSIFTFIDHLSLILIPAISTVFLIISGILWVVWWIMISIRLLQLGAMKMENQPA